MRQRLPRSYGAPMPAADRVRTFLAECYAPDIARSDVEAIGHRAATAAAELRREGRAIEYVRALFVPGDDAVFHVFTADVIDTVHEAGQRAAMSFARVVESETVEATRPRERRTVNQ
ncbi:MAG TPA: hypothetical protein VFQ81_08565 [Candidatus Limnocylindria bacterium]|nr:hypothetical protein [Candidatus Limnocylindria bacterium]